MTGRGEEHGGRAEPSVDADPLGYQRPVWEAGESCPIPRADPSALGRGNLCWFGARVPILVLKKGKKGGRRNFLAD